MTRQYSPRSFLRHAPNALLDQYFHERGLLKELGIAALPETDIEPLYKAWMSLQPERSVEADSDFALVDLLADELGIQTLISEAAFHDLDLVPAFESLAGFHDKALWTLLEHRNVVDVAARLWQADRLPDSAWYRRREAVPLVEASDDAQARSSLAKNLGAYFQLKEGRGRECFVDVYRRGDAVYYFAFPEDYGKTDLVYEEGRLERRALRPVFQVVYLYDPSQGFLDTFCRGSKKGRLELEKIFGRVILGTEFRPLTDESVYDLNIFKSRNVRFIYDPVTGIQDVRVKLLRCSLLGGGKRRLTLEADPADGRAAVYDLVEGIFSDDGNGATGKLSLTLANVTRVGIEAVFAPDGRRGRRTRTFYLTYPNSCTLKHDDSRDAALRQMLIDSNIEPVKPAAAAARG